VVPVIILSHLTLPGLQIEDRMTVRRKIIINDIFVRSQKTTVFVAVDIGNFSPSVDVIVAKMYVRLTRDTTVIRRWSLC